MIGVRAVRAICQGLSCTCNIRVRGRAVRAISGSGVELYVQYQGQGLSCTCNIGVRGRAVRAISGYGVELYVQYQGQGSSCTRNIRVKGRAVRDIRVRGRALPFPRGEFSPLSNDFDGLGEGQEFQLLSFV